MTKNLSKIPPEKYSKYSDLHETPLQNIEPPPLEKNLGSVSFQIYGILIISCLFIIWFIFKYS